MRGQLKLNKSLTISGKLYIHNYNESGTPEKGDILLSPHIENKNNYLITPELYHQTGNKGYLRLHIFTGQDWGSLLPMEFFLNKENHFNKKELIIDTCQICLEIARQFQGTKVNKTYREHYSMKEYEPNPFKGKKGHYNKP